VSYNANDNQFSTTPSVQRVPDAVVPKARSSAILRVLGSMLALSFLAACAVIGLVVWGFGMFSAPGPLVEQKIVYIPPDLERPQIVALLKEQGVVQDTVVLNAALGVQYQRGARVKPGEYEFSKGHSMEDVLSILLQGRTITYKVTIPEGWTTQMALNRLTENEVLTGELPAAPPEGGIMADTFVFQRGMTREKLVADMVAGQEKLLDAVWSLRAPDSPIANKTELVTLASIVEKETGKAEERPLVAAVFLNRLKKGMRLQSDPTIIYGIVGGKGKLDRPLSREDIETTTPYNTYRVNGLPPGPIANPGRASLEAVLKPAAVDYLYFVADGTGGHAFATTLEEHNDNVKKWRTLEDGKVQDSDAAAPAAAVPAKKPENTATGLEQLKLGEQQEPAAEDAKKDEQVKPVAKKPETKKPETKKPVTKKIDDKLPVEKKKPIAEKKPSDKKSTEKKAREKKKPTKPVEKKPDVAEQ
jgi:UPF0755 protein